MNIVMDTRLALQGDQEAFIRLINQFELSLYRVAKAFLKKDEDCSDAIQETIVAAYQQLHTLKKPEYIKTWMIRICINQCQMILRKQNRIVTTDVVENSIPSDSKFESIEIKEAVGQLEETLKVVVVLHYFEDLTIREIAELLQTPEGTIKSRLHRARSVFVVCGLIFGTAYVFPSWMQALQQIPVVGNIFKSLGGKGEKQAAEENLVSEINQSVTNQGITLTISEVLFDGTRFSIGYIVELNHDQKISKEATPLIDNPGEFIISINGKEINSSKSMSREEDLGTKKEFGMIQLNQVNDLPDQFEAEVHVHTIGKIKGDWKFRFPVRKIPPKVFEPNLSVKDGNVTIRADKIILAAGSTQVNLRVEGPLNSVRRKFYIFDDQGNKLKSVNQTSDGKAIDNDRFSEIYYFHFDPLKRKPHYLLVKDVKKHDEYIERVIVNLNNPPTPSQPIILSQGILGETKITQIERLTDRTEIHYQSTGASKESHYIIATWKKQLNEEKDYIKPLKEPRLVKEHPNSYILTLLPLKKDTSIYLNAQAQKDPVYNEDLTLKIPLKE
ncbi:sigma-70 family RNA polymerase sigma factor [Hazenella coriacea]|uniref:RNA polymerase sigma factor (Sigma-70 family) n=1 Tax=Hazenella coriacea TaxID=1179467 RepID=A0A4R3LBT7_9BACL|nr:sigma-70 family RNA polymerase sigma factor [Hazenella coriacea]TCS96700.1 RNA polymerase sigma factor (sigma-70 family) [Hazenella coriacea]